MCSTPIGITGTGTCGQAAHPRRTAVLNADWHHGDGHEDSEKGEEGKLVCSTPIGITGTGTSRASAKYVTTRVLNADWHHGDGHHQLHGANAL